jgi:Transcriptional regulator
VQKKDKREAILQAALELIAAHGFQHTPMSAIARQANVSAGIIYHYFTGKEEVIRALYRRVKGEFGVAIFSAYDPQMPLRERFPVLWISAFRYCLSHPAQTAFLQQCESLPDWQGEEISEEEQALYRLLDEYRGHGLLKDLPPLVLYELTLGVAIKMASSVYHDSLYLDESTLITIADACWDAIER